MSRSHIVGANGAMRRVSAMPVRSLVHPPAPPRPRAWWRRALVALLPSLN